MEVKRTLVVKYPACQVMLQVGDIWYVQIEPIMLGTSVQKMRVSSLSEKTVGLRPEPDQGFMQNQFKHMHSSVLFIERVS